MNIIYLIKYTKQIHCFLTAKNKSMTGQTSNKHRACIPHVIKQRIAIIYVFHFHKNLHGYATEITDSKTLLLKLVPPFSFRRPII